MNSLAGYSFTTRPATTLTPGAGSDTFRIDVSGPNGFAYHNEGTLTHGDITLKR